MAETLTRAGITVTPALILPGRLTRAARSVVHEVLGDDEPDVTERAPASRAGDLRLIFASPADAASAQDVLSAVGGPWTITDTADLDGSWQVVGDVAYEPAAEAVRSRLVTIGVREVIA